jgi:hypothetical protein
MVGERSLGVEADSGEHLWSAGKRVCRNEYTINRVRIPVTESLRVPEPGSSAPGQSVPKTRPKGVVDGKQVNIPVPGENAFDPEGGRGSERTVGWWNIRCKEVGDGGD